MVGTLVSLWALVLSAADTACAESGRDYRDGAAVLQVVRNRARSRGRRYDGTLATALWSPQQHAHGCRWPLTAEHVRLGAQFVADRLPVEPWARRAIYYCSPRDAPGSCARRAGPWLGRHAHDFYGRR